MKRSTAQRLGLPVLGVFRSFAAVGVDPAVMGIGPAVAIPAAVQQAGLRLQDIDLFEINEAFASQATYCVNHLGLDTEVRRLAIANSTNLTTFVTNACKHIILVMFRK
jgi:acetyl-CoA acyltransferase 1